MRVHLQQVGSVDAHKKTAVATRMRVNEKEVDGLESETETFGTTTPDLLKLHDWLQEWGCSHVVIESTGDYWKPIFNLLEGNFEVWLVNAKHVHNVPGRKTDVSDSEWLAELMMYGLLRASFIPPKPQRALRDLTRYRTRLIQERARTVNRVQKLLEGANIKLASVVSDVMGVSARAMLAAIVDGESDATLMAELARGRLRNKLPELEKALTGLVQPHHRFLLATQLSHIDFLGEQIEAISAEIGRQLEAMDRPPDPPRGNGAASDEEAEDGPQEEPLTWAQAIAIVKTHPGIDTKAAEDLLAECGIHLDSQFPSASHFTSWLGLCPGNIRCRRRLYSKQLRTHPPREHLRQKPFCPGGLVGHPGQGQRLEGALSSSRPPTGQETSHCGHRPFNRRQCLVYALPAATPSGVGG